MGRKGSRRLGFRNQRGRERRTRREAWDGHRGKARRSKYRYN